jgi:hypothetical protein
MFGDATEAERSAAMSAMGPSTLFMDALTKLERGHWPALLRRDSLHHHDIQREGAVRLDREMLRHLL